MASFRKMQNGRWRAEISRQGKRRSRVFDSKASARDWAVRQEALIATEPERIRAATITADVFNRYASEVSPNKRGERWEILRLRALSKEPWAAKPIAKVTTDDLTAWRDARMAVVSAGTVIREMGLVSAVFTHAQRDWKLISENPLKGVRRPKQPPPRDRRVTEAEIERLVFVAGDDLSTMQGRAIHAFLFAIETAMRAGEIVGLTWDRVHLDRRFVELIDTKNGHPRQVPLSSRAVALIKALPKADPLFDITSQKLDALFRKVRDKAGIEGLTFHDSRAEATTRLSKKVDVLTLARIVGHRNIQQLMTYYRESAEDIAGRLD